MPQQLRMIFDCAVTTLPALTPPAGFRVRAMQPGEEEAYLQLRLDGGFASSNWNRDNLNKLWLKPCLTVCFSLLTKPLGRWQPLRR